jgi:hypothetical protein
MYLQSVKSDKDNAAKPVNRKADIEGSVSVYFIRPWLRVNTGLGEGVRRVVRSYSKQLDRPRLGMFRYSHIFKIFTHSIVLIFRITYSEIFKTTCALYYIAVSLFTFILVDILYAYIFM